MEKRHCLMLSSLTMLVHVTVEVQCIEFRRHKLEFTEHLRVLIESLGDE